ncbi:MAG: amidohydrolase family protein, partial [Planctomycetota bacterium]|nr:amidohydrolase family protein [Planctomycetota bacterium]
MLLALLAFDLVAVVGGKVHTLVPGSKPAEMTVLIDDDRIRAVGADVAIPAGAKRIDARGLHIVPGLIDGFGYHDPEHDPLYLAAGIAVLRDHGNELGRIFSSRERSDRDANAGPSLSICGAVLDGDPPATNAALIVRQPVDAEEAVIHQFEEKIDFVAFHSNLPIECLKPLCKVAGQRKLPVWGPRLGGQTLGEAIEAGQSGFVFLDCVLPRGKRWEEIELNSLDATIAELAKAKVGLVPALRGYARLIEDDGDAAPELALLSSQYETMWRADLAQRREALKPEMRSKVGAVIGKQRALLPLLHAAGVALVPGSGAPHPWLMPGDGLVRELVEWQTAGIPPAACLEYATSRAATTLGLARDRGTLEAGKLADLVLLRADPTTDIRALSQVESVVQRGRPFARAELDARLESLRLKFASTKAQAQAPLELGPLALPEGTQLLSGTVETIAVTGRVAGERFAVVRELDGTETICGRRRILSTAGNPESEVETRQRVVKGALDSFEIKVRNSGHELLVKGQRVTGQWRVERRFDGTFVDIQAAREQLAAIDCDSVTSMIVIGRTRQAGPMPVVRFDEGLQLEVVRWDVSFDDDGDHKFRTPSGFRIASFLENGAPKVVLQQLGSSQAQTTLTSVDTHGTEGYSLPPEKLERMRKQASGGGDGG